MSEPERRRKGPSARPDSLPETGISATRPIANIDLIPALNLDPQTRAQTSIRLATTPDILNVAGIVFPNGMTTVVFHNSLEGMRNYDIVSSRFVPIGEVRDLFSSGLRKEWEKLYGIGDTVINVASYLGSLNFPTLEDPMVPDLDKQELIARSLAYRRVKAISNRFRLDFIINEVMRAAAVFN